MSGHTTSEKRCSASVPNVRRNVKGPQMFGVMLYIPILSLNPLNISQVGDRRVFGQRRSAAYEFIKTLHEDQTMLRPVSGRSQEESSDWWNTDRREGTSQRRRTRLRGSSSLSAGLLAPSSVTLRHACLPSPHIQDKMPRGHIA